MPDQSALTIARLLVERIISRHGVPLELLSDRGAAFLSKLLKEVCKLMGINHPQTDGLVERFNRTLTDMLAKTVEKNGKNWDTQIPYVLFAYRTSPQESTNESPFFLLYGRDALLPVEETLSPAPCRSAIDISDYKCEVQQSMQESWDLARENIKKAQKRQKKAYDRRCREPTFRAGERVFLHIPSARSGQAYKFSLPYKGPYRILKMFGNTAEIVLIGHRSGDMIRVSSSRLRHCPDEIFTPSEEPIALTNDTSICENQPDTEAGEDNSFEENVTLESNGTMESMTSNTDEQGRISIGNESARQASSSGPNEHQQRITVEDTSENGASYQLMEITLQYHNLSNNVVLIGGPGV